MPLDATMPECVATPDSRNDPACIRVQQPRWAVLATYPQAEAWAESNLRQRGYTPFLPRYTARIRDRPPPPSHASSTPTVRRIHLLPARSTRPLAPNPVLPRHSRKPHRRPRRPVCPCGRIAAGGREAFAAPQPLPESLARLAPPAAPRRAVPRATSSRHRGRTPTAPWSPS